MSSPAGSFEARQPPVTTLKEGYNEPLSRSTIPLDIIVVVVAGFLS